MAGSMPAPAGAHLGASGTGVDKERCDLILFMGWLINLYIYIFAPSFSLWHAYGATHHRATDLCTRVEVGAVKSYHAPTRHIVHPVFSWVRMI